MALVQRLKEAVFGEEDERTYRYHCQACDSRFESVETSVAALACPECGVDDHRSLFKL